MKIRIKFQKWGCMKFIGHLDMMRYFQKAMRRAEIDICYSEGFSPHQKMSFAAPLGVGITSDGEYFDIEVNSSPTSKEAIDKINGVMVDGVRVTGYRLLPDDAKNAMSIVAAADYRLSYKDGYDSPMTTEEWRQVLADKFEAAPEFTVIKQTKKNQRQIDIKPLIYSFKVTEEDNKPVFDIMLSTGSVDNLKPEFVLESIYQTCGMEYNPLAIAIHRNEVYARENDKFVDLLSLGQEIS